VRFIETKLAGTFIVEQERLEDERGFFARTWCRHEFGEHGLTSALAQCNISRSSRRGTLRGMHYQLAPHREAKLVRCTRGALYDVAVDLRSESPTFRDWVAVELTEDNSRMLYVPEGCAHGFQTLVDNTEVFYQMSESYDPDAARGVRWNDPAFGINWPMNEAPIMSARDAHYADFTC